MKTKHSRSLLFALALACMLPGMVATSVPAQAQQESTASSQEKPAAQETASTSDAENAEKLRKEAQNPVASLISVPIQENWNFNIGPADRTQNVLNVQPVIPLGLRKDWNLIVRWITPVIYQPVALPQVSGPPVQSGVYGFGDMQPHFFSLRRRAS